MSPNEPFTEVAELTGGFIHDIKNHISTLNLNLQLLAEDYQDPQNPRERRAKQRIDRLLNQCQKLVDVSNDFLRYIRAQELKLEPTPLEDVIGEMLDFFTPTAKAAGIDIQFHPSPCLPPVPIDRDLFKQSLLNLMLNAEQAMPDGGQMVLQTRSDNEFAYVDIIDTGIGMDAETLNKIFRPFHTTKPGGTGLGLPTTRKIIESHGGTITVQSDPGHGTIFTIKLPLVA